MLTLNGGSNNIILTSAAVLSFITAFKFCYEHLFSFTLFRNTNVFKLLSTLSQF